MSKAVQLQRADTGASVDLWQCTACCTYWPSADAAGRCCLCRFCGELLDEGGHGLGRSHRSCLDESVEREDAARLEKATPHEGYEGPVYLGGDLYAGSPAEALGVLEDLESEVPEWAHCCKIHPVITANLLDSMIESATDDAYEDAADDITLTPQLEEAWRDFVDANKNVVTWSPDYSRKVRLRGKA